MTRELPRWVTWVLFVVIGVLAFSAGHYLGPERVETSFVDVTRVKWRDRWHKAITKTTVISVEKKPDGTERSTTRIDEKSNEGSEIVGQADTETKSTTLTINRPDWRVGVQLGASVVKPLIPISDTPLIVQVCGDRRIVGGVSAGLCASTVGSITAGVSIEF